MPVKNGLTAALLLLMCGCFLILADQSRAAGINQMQTAGNNILYFDAGLFSPTGDLDDYGYDTGYNFSLGYQAFPWNFFGFEIAGNYKYMDVSYERTETITETDEYGYTQEDDRTLVVDEGLMTAGLELLCLAKYDIADFQTYGGLGVGYYYSNINREPFNKITGEEYSSESYDGSDLGFIIKIGARYFLTHSFSLGANFKYTTLEVDYSGDRGDFSTDSDGYGINLEAGYSF